MATLPIEFKKRIANMYLKDRQNLEKIDASVMESFSSELIEMIEKEKERTKGSHDLEVLEQSMKHLKDDSAKLKNYKPGTDDYDFTHNDCKNLVNSLKRWLTVEGLI